MSSSLLTCITCKVGFLDAANQRDHYKTDWHRYNLKRKVAELPPVSESDFQNRMAKHEEQKKVLSGEIKAPTGYCVACSKSFANEKAYDNHLKSKKHLEAAKSFQAKENKDEIERNRRNRKLTEEQENEESEDEDIEEVDSDEWDEDDEFGDEADAIANFDCFFCSHHSSNIEKNLLHMSEKHSFFVPDLEFVVELDELLTYIGAKVGQGKMCLWCNEKSKRFRSVDAVQKHMRDCGHCKIAFSGGDAIVEFADFYDYSKSYPEDQDPEQQADEDKDMEVDVNTLDDSGYELMLPSGAKIGHRSLMRYYKQSLNPDRQVVLRKANQKVLDHYKSFGGLNGLTYKEAKTKARDIKFFRSHQQKYWMKLGTRANNLQKHFRDPTMHVG